MTTVIGHAAYIRLVGRIEPALRFYPTQQNPIAEVDYWIGLREARKRNLWRHELHADQDRLLGDVVPSVPCGDALHGDVLGGSAIGLAILAVEGPERVRDHRRKETREMSTSEGKMAKDPVCGMTVEEDRAAAIAVYQGKTYYFCAVGCKEAFLKNPQQYVGGKRGSAL